MKYKFTSDIHGNKYYGNQLNGKWCLIVCMTDSIQNANAFLMDNHDCSVIAEIGGIVLIAFTDDLGIDSVI